MYNLALAERFKSKLDAIPAIEYYDDNVCSESYYASDNPGLRISIAGLGTLGDNDTVCIDLYTSQYYGGVHDFITLPDRVQRVFEWYRHRLSGKGDFNMTKKEINAVIGEDIQKLAKDLTKKREMDKANSSAEDIAKKLGVKLPKSKK